MLSAVQELECATFQVGFFGALREQHLVPQVAYIGPDRNRMWFDTLSFRAVILLDWRPVNIPLHPFHVP